MSDIVDGSAFSFASDESAAWETEEEFNEKHEEDPAMAVEVPMELREEGSESDNVDTISNINEEEILPAGDDKVVGTSGEKTPC